VPVMVGFRPATGRCRENVASAPGTGCGRAWGIPRAEPAALPVGPRVRRTCREGVEESRLPCR
jgi:hypothetical protein